jgi:hypothetical protein
MVPPPELADKVIQNDITFCAGEVEVAKAPESSLLRTSRDAQHQCRV